MPRKPRNSPRPAGRPRKAVAAVAAGVAAVERGELAPEDAAAAAGVARSTLYAARARQKLGGGVVAVKGSAAPASPSPAPVAPPAAPQGPPLAIPPDVAPRVEALRKMVREGDWDSRSIGRLAAGMGVSAGEVWLLLQQAALLAASEELPPALAREQSLDAARRWKKKAEDAADWKSALSAQAHIDALLIPRGASKVAPVPADLMPRADVVASLRRVRDALAGCAGCTAAMRAALAVT